MQIADLKGFFEIELLKSLKRPIQGEWSSKRLFDSMNYALSSPGKRIRPLLVLASACAVHHGRPIKKVLNMAMPSALAIEYIHTYSLIHDDLPAMDNDDFRRGRLSVHRQFDEALAVLAGDALLTDAFLLALSSPVNAVKIGQELAQCAGSSALVAGQAEDLNTHDPHKDRAQWVSINYAKTARLFEASAVIGGLSQEAANHEISLLRSFGQAFGSAFQIKDDVEDNQGLQRHIAKTELLDLKMNSIQKSHHIAAGLNQPYLLNELLYGTFLGDVLPS
jgi:geranylgeranyl diphosphate synthase, type II